MDALNLGNKIGIVILLRAMGRLRRMGAYQPVIQVCAPISSIHVPVDSRLYSAIKLSYVILSSLYESIDRNPLTVCSLALGCMGNL